MTRIWALPRPPIWYLARLHLTSGGVIGATIPGMPVVLLGRSERLGWGLTSCYLDDQDVVIEKMNPENPEQYITPTGPKDFVTRRTIITVKDADPVTITQRWSESGPILPGTHFDLATVTPAGHGGGAGMDGAGRRRHLDVGGDGADAAQARSMRRWRRARCSWPRRRT